MRRLAAAAACVLGLVCAGRAADDGLAGGGASYLSFPLGARAIGMGHAQAAAPGGDAASLQANNALMALQPAHTATITTGQLALGRTINSAAYIFPLRVRKPDQADSCGSQLEDSLTQAEKLAVRKIAVAGAQHSVSPCSRAAQKDGGTRRGDDHWDEFLVETDHSDMAFGVAFTRFGISGINGRSEFGAPESDFSDSEQAVYAGYAVRMYSNLSVGIGVKFLTQTLQAATAKGSGIDVGAWYGVPHISRGQLNVGLAYRDNGSKLAWNVPDPVLDATFSYSEKVPGKLILGTSYLTPGGTLLLAADVWKVTGQRTRLYGGLEWRVIKNFYLRGGLSANNPTAGFSWSLKGGSLDLQLDYAYEYDLQSLSSPTWLTLSLRFLSKKRAS